MHPGAVSFCGIDCCFIDERKGSTRLGITGGLGGFGGESVSGGEGLQATRSSNVILRFFLLGLCVGGGGGGVGITDLAEFA